MNSEEVDRVFKSAEFINHLGIEMRAAQAGRCETFLEIEKRHLQQDGFVHAGVQATIADHTGGAAAATMFRAGQWPLSAELSISYLRAARGERLECIAEVLKAGRSLYVVESEVWCLGGGRRTMTAKAKVTIAVLTKE